MGEFSWDDALVLLALLQAGDEGSNLAGIAGYCDYVNHARPSEEELRVQMDRLIAAGHARGDGSLYRPTDAARKGCEPELSRRSHLKAVDGVARFLPGTH